VFETLQQILITSWSPVWSFWQYLFIYLLTPCSRVLEKL